MGKLKICLSIFFAATVTCVLGAPQGAVLSENRPQQTNQVGSGAQNTYTTQGLATNPYTQGTNYGYPGGRGGGGLVYSDNEPVQSNSVGPNAQNTYTTQGLSTNPTTIGAQGTPVYYASQPAYITAQPAPTTVVAVPQSNPGYVNPGTTINNGGVGITPGKNTQNANKSNQVTNTKVDNGSTSCAAIGCLLGNLQA